MGTGKQSLLNRWERKVDTEENICRKKYRWKMKEINLWATQSRIKITTYGCQRIDYQQCKITGSKRQGRPKNRWRIEVLSAINDIVIIDWCRKAGNRAEWTKILHKAKTCLFLWYNNRYIICIMVIICLTPNFTL